MQLAKAPGAQRVVAAVGSPVLDGAGGAALHRSIAALATFGRLVSYSAAGTTVVINDLRSQARSIIGFAVAHLAWRSPQRYAQHREELWRLAAEGQLHATVHAALPLTDAVHAHCTLLARNNLARSSYCRDEENSPSHSANLHAILNEIVQPLMGLQFPGSGTQSSHRCALLGDHCAIMVVAAVSLHLA